MLDDSVRINNSESVALILLITKPGIQRQVIKPTGNNDGGLLYHSVYVLSESVSVFILSFICICLPECLPALSVCLSVSLSVCLPSVMPTPF